MRDRSLDMLHFATVFAVVVQHCVWVPADAGVAPALVTLGLAIWAVPLLFATSGFLSTYSGGGVDPRKRMRRLLVPYAVWSVVLYAYAAQGAIRAGVPMGGTNWLGVIFAGQAFYTLWFLAMLVYVTIIGWALRSDRSRLVGAGVAALAYASIAVARAGQPIMPTDSWTGFVAIGPLCVAAYLVGAVLPNLARPSHAAVPITVAGLAIAADAAMYAAWGTELLQEQQFAILSAGTVAAIAVLRVAAHADLTSRVAGHAAWAGAFALGVYVVHLPVLNLLRLATGTRESASYPWALALSVLVYATSLGISFAISRVRRLQRLVT